jgi:RNA polymerase sigma-70 factor (ECF subfamily)
LCYTVFKMRALQSCDIQEKPRTTERTNQDWLAELRGPGPDQALADLRTRLVHGLRYAMADRPGVTDADMQDFAQDALMKILAGLDSFRGESRFTTWAQKIAVRVALSELRRRRWRDISLQELAGRYQDADRMSAVLTDPAASPEQEATQLMMLEMVHHLIAEELTERQRQAVTAAMIGGMELDEVARRMGTNRNALYKLLHDARRRLQERLAAKGLSAHYVLTTFEL